MLMLMLFNTMMATVLLLHSHDAACSRVEAVAVGSFLSCPVLIAFGALGGGFPAAHLHQFRMYPSYGAIPDALDSISYFHSDDVSIAAFFVGGGKDDEL